MSIKITTEDFINEAIQKHGDKYDYSLVKYIGCNEEVEIICKKHNGTFFQAANAHLRGNGCRICRKTEGQKKSGVTRTWTTTSFIEKAKMIHGDHYDYSLVKYVNIKTNIDIICPVHKIFSQRPGHHLEGAGCKKCGQRKNSTEFINEASLVHNNLYSYENVKYINAKLKINITCPIHGNFIQEPDSHLRGCGCPECKLITREDFVKKASSIYDNFYNYSLMDYYGYADQTEINCKMHGTFNIIPYMHLRGSACPGCTSPKSKKEIKWLNSLNVPKDKNHRQVLLDFNNEKYFIADGFDEKTNTVYEFHGDYYHGNLNIFDTEKINTKIYKTFGELYQKTIEREKLIKDAGFNLITIWEEEWDKIVKLNKSV